MLIREIALKDAYQLMNLVKQVESESEFMLFEAAERVITLEKQLRIIKDNLNSENSTIFVVENDKKLIGYLMVFGGGCKRNKHSAYLVIGILKEHIGKGIGTNLFRKLENWADKHNIHRLELTVMEHNKAAIALYKKMGYEIEGTKKHSLLVNGVYIDEYYMAKIL